MRLSQSAVLWQGRGGLQKIALFGKRPIQGTLNQHYLPQHSAVIHLPIWFALSGTIICFSNRTMTQLPPRLCKGYLTEKESDGMLHQMTWPPQSPDLNQFEMVWDESLNQPTSAQHVWELLQDCWKSIPGEAWWENAKSVQSWHQICLKYVSNIKYILICWTGFCLLHNSICYFLMSSLLLYNVENRKN